MPSPESSPLVQPAVSTANSITLPSTQAAHAVIASSSQVTHDDTIFPSQVRHGVTSFPSEGIHDALDFPPQLRSTRDTMTFPPDDVHDVTNFPSGVTRDAILISSPTPLQLYTDSVTVPTTATSEVAGQKTPAPTNTLPTVPMNTAPEPVEAESVLFGQLTNGLSPISTIAPPVLLTASFTSCVGSVTTAVNCVTFASDVVSADSGIGDVNSVDVTVASDVIAGQSGLYTSMTPTPASWLPTTVPPTPVPLQPSQGRENASELGSLHLATGTLPSARPTRAESLLSTEPTAPVDQSSFALWSRSFPPWSADGHSSSEAGVVGGRGDQLSLHAADTTELPPGSVQTSFPPHAVTSQPSGAAPGLQGNSSASRETKHYKLCPCACAYRKETADVSDSQSLASALQRLRRELHVPRDQLSATIRSKTSAPDHRKSSVATGIVGMSVLGILALLLVAADVISVVSFLHDVITRRHRVRSV